MTITLVFLAGLMATVVWWLVRQTVSVSPWIADSGTEPIENTRGLHVATLKVGLGVFLGVAASLFALFVSAYMMRMEAHDWLTLDDPAILWVNTAALIVASVFFQHANNLAKKQQPHKMLNPLLLAGLFTFLFLFGQLRAWQELNDAGFYASSNPANAFFFLLTAVHGLHLLGGLWVWGTTVLTSGSEQDLEKTVRRVDLCTVYWHFLLAVWLVLFTLLLTT